MIHGCLYGRGFGEPCGPETPEGELCEPCARARGIVAPRGRDALEAAYLAGYGQGWTDQRSGAPFGDLEGVAAFLRGRAL